jgi:hypothetical protein
MLFEDVQKYHANVKLMLTLRKCLFYPLQGKSES